MIINKIRKAAHILGVVPDLTNLEGDKKLFGVIHDGRVTAMSVEDSALAPIEEPLLIISCYPKFAAGLYENAPHPVWLYDRIEDIQDMCLATPKNPGWVVLVVREEDAVAKMLASRWSGEYEVSIMVGEEKQFSDMFTADSQATF